VFTLIKEQPGQIRSASLQFHQPNVLVSEQVCISATKKKETKKKSMLDMMLLLFLFSLTLFRTEINNFK